MEEPWLWWGSYIPGRGAVVRLGDVMVAFSMATEVEDFVLGTGGCFGIKNRDLVLESQPSGQFAGRVEISISIIDLIDQTEVVGDLICISKPQ